MLKIKYKNRLYKMFTTTRDLTELENLIKSMIKIEMRTEIVLEFEEGDEVFVFHDFHDLASGMTLIVAQLGIIIIFFFL